MYADLKKELLSIPKPYAGYKVHISADPMAWYPLLASADQAHLFAQQVAEKAKCEFPGIVTDISWNPCTYPFGGKDLEVLERLEEWLEVQCP